MADATQGCADTKEFVIRRTTPFYPEVSLVRSVEVPNQSSLEPYVCDHNRRNQFALAIGTRAYFSDGKHGTLLYFVIGSENPKGFSTGGAGQFTPRKDAKAVVDWKDTKDGTLAIVTFDGVQYRLRLRMLQVLPRST